MYILEHSKLVGDVSVGNFKNCIKLSSVDFSSGMNGNNTIGVNKRDIGSLQFSSISVSKIHCSASYLILQQALIGSGTDCKIHFLDSNNRVYLSLELKNTLINNFEFSAHNFEPVEKFYLTFTYVTFRSTPKDKTPCGASFDLMKGSCL